MNIQIQKDIFTISANEKKIECNKERLLVDSVTKIMCSSLGITGIDGCDDEYEYYLTVGFSSTGYTIEDIKEAYKDAKREYKSK